MKASKLFYVLMIVLVLAACLPAEPTPAPTEAPVELTKMSYITVKVYDPVFVAKDQGFFENRGLDVEILFTTGGPNAVQAVSSGQIHAGQAAVPVINNANVAGLPIQAVLDMQTIKSDFPIFRWYVRADSGIQSFSDLKDGKYKVAVNALKAYTYYTYLRAFAKYGIDPANIEFVAMPFPDQANALMKGDVDVVAYPIPFAEFTVRDLGDKVVELENSYEIAGDHASSYIFLNRVWAQSNTETAQAFVTAIAEAEDWIMLNQEQAKVIVSKYTEIPAEVLPDFFYNAHGAVDMAQIQAWQDYQKSTGDIAVDWLTAEQVATNEYNLLLK